MKRENIVLAQLSEALRLAEHNIFEYRRISLILLDNIIENLLPLHIYNHVRYDRVFDKITKEEQSSILDSLNRFENITKYSRKYKIISEKEKPILDFCHKARNNVYHGLYEDERITSCCLFILSEFLFNNLKRLMNSGVYEISDEFDNNRKTILEIGKLETEEKLYAKLDSFNTNNTRPAEILGQILIDNLTELIEFKESSANEDWERFNSIIKDQYFWDISYKNEIQKNSEIDIKLLFMTFKKKWRDLKQSEYDKHVIKSIELKNLSTYESFEKYLNISNRIEPFYLGMKYYDSN